MRLLLANPNTTQAVTDRVADAARRVAGPGTEIVTATATFGAAVIGTRTEMAVAEHASVSLLAQHATGCDGAIVAASLDSGVRAAREMLAVPVLGITEAALHTACLLGGRFGVLTLSARSAAVTREMIEAYGLLSRMAGLRFLATAPQDLLRDPDAAVPALTDAAHRLVRDDLADVVVLVGAVMAGMPERMAGRMGGRMATVGVPVIEGVSCAVPLLEGLIRLALPKAVAGSYAALEQRPLTGVDPALQARFGV